MALSRTKARFFGERVLEHSLRKPFDRALFVAAIGVLVIPLGYKTVRIATAATIGAFPTKANLRRAIRLDPANPRYYERMAVIYQISVDTNYGESVRWFGKAASLEPQNGFYWEMLGRACEFAGDKACARDSFARALALNPMTPRLEWLTANDDLLAGAPEQAAPHFRRLLEMDPRYAGAVLATCLRAYGSPQFVVEHILPSGSAPALKLAFINDLMQRGDSDVANHSWADLVSAHAQFDFASADPYLESLISSGQISQAERVWRDLERLGILPGADDKGKTKNLVYNPGFEWNPLNAGFDWRKQNVLYVDTEFSDSSAYHGRRCLRVDYDFPENQTSEPVYELVPVSPGQTYRLSGWVRSQDITSDSGPRLRVTDPQHPGCLQAETKDTEGTTDWHEVGLTFSTCATTDLVRLSVWRPRGYDFPNEISGHFWVDDVRIEPEAPSRVQASMMGNR